MSNKKEIPNISASEAAKMSVSALAVRPNDASRFGQGGLSAKDLQAWFDKLPNLVKEKFNEIARVLASSEAAKYIGTDALGVDNLYDFLLLFGPRGTGVNDKNISDYIETLYAPLGESTEKSVALKDIVSDIARRLVDASAGHVVDAHLESVTNTLVITFADGTDARVDLSPLAAGVGVQGEIDRLKETDVDFERRLSNIEEHISDDYFVTDDTVAYEKAVPARACTYAKLARLGGMTHTCNNLIKFPYVQASNSIFTASNDGTIAINGSGNLSYSLRIKDLELKAGTTYTLSGIDSSGGYQSYYLYVNEPDGTNRFDLGNGITFTANSDGLASVTLVINSTTSISTVVKPMLNEGSTALPFESWYEGTRDSKVTEIKNHGANKLPYPHHQKNITHRGITFTDNGDGSITLNGTADGNAVCYLYTNAKLNSLFAGKTYIPSLSNPSVSSKVVLMCNYVDAIEGIQKNFTTSQKGAAVYPSNSQGDAIYLLVLPDTVLDNVTVYPMINEGSTAVPFKVYREPTYYPIPAAIQAINGYGKDGFVIDLEKQTSAYEGSVAPLPVSLEPIIEVEGGGSLEFVNEYKNPVPSTVKYLLKEESSV